MADDLQQKTAAYLTHELKAPLTAIRCALELLRHQGQAMPAGNQEVISLALQNVDRLQMLVKDILDLSKIQAGRMKLESAPCDPARLVREAVSSLQPWAQKKGLRLTGQCAQGCPEAAADARRTVQVLINLISNAIKFTPEGGSISVRAFVGRRDDAGYVCFEVADTGCGIAASDMHKIFRYFSQAGEGRKKEEGTGLGLALSRSLIEIQGGSISVDSKPGEGSTFRFTLPIHLAERPGDPGAAPGQARSSQPCAEGPEVV